MKQLGVFVLPPGWDLGGAVASRLVLRMERSAFEPWPGTLCCVLGQDTLLSRKCLWWGLFQTSLIFTLFCFRLQHETRLNKKSCFKNTTSKTKVNYIHFSDLYFLGITGYQDSTHGFWLANCELRYSNYMHDTMPQRKSWCWTGNSSVPWSCASSPLTLWHHKLHPFLGKRQHLVSKSVLSLPEH